MSAESRPTWILAHLDLGPPRSRPTRFFSEPTPERDLFLLVPINDLLKGRNKEQPKYLQEPGSLTHACFLTPTYASGGGSFHVSSRASAIQQQQDPRFQHRGDLED
ncbi:hypothetical protein DAPPUDRAFT_238888 [Daphnia pulex]|uniref:Uncharacterized protein n=1 Tax=Daphnia pulex TaxID=6669 RepID=E9G7P7_DAPPU|nr:hypothetical protein DAPPUDRAFT_238888 [Daphnia pulex]|eukprot:EFX84514.1 hypothetical protein DAPPUDRAFT_238888 [Daphnia pulex]